MTCPEPVHDHDRHCYWDHLRCGWVCPPSRLDEARPEPQLAPWHDAGPRQFLTSRR